MKLEFPEGEKRIALCRCWQSKKFPYCDGSHRAYCETTDDTLGPIIVTLGKTDEAPPSST